MWVVLFSFARYLTPDISAGADQILVYVITGLSIPVLTYSGWSIYKMAYINLINKSYNMDVLITLGVFSGVGVSLIHLTQPRPELFLDTCVMLITAFSLTRLLEQLHFKRERAQLTQWLNDFDTQVQVITNKQTTPTELDQVKAKDQIQIYPEQPIFFDCRVLNGTSDVDYSDLHGEPYPSHVQAGDVLRKGGVNRSGLLTVEVAEANPCAYPVHLEMNLRKALSVKSVERARIDQAAAFFLTFGLIMAGVQLCLLLLTFDPGAGNDFASTLFITLFCTLLVACPCSLALSIPAIEWVMKQYAEKIGVTLLQADRLFNLNRIKHFLFDKTGTITEPNIRVTDIKLHADAQIQEIARITLAMEQGITHPVATALCNWAAAQGAIDPIRSNAVAQLTLHPGAGVTAQIGDDIYTLTHPNSQLVTSQSLLNPLVNPFDHRPGKPMCLLKNNTPLCSWLIAEQVRPGFNEFIDFLNTQSIQSTIISGDEPANVEQVIKHTHFFGARHGNCSPQDKSEILLSKKPACVIGDGSNDTLAMASADVSIAIKPNLLLRSTCSAVINCDDNLFDKVKALFTFARRARFALILTSLGFFTYLLVLNLMIATGHIFAQLIFLSPLMVLAFVILISWTSFSLNTPLHPKQTPLP